MNIRTIKILSMNEEHLPTLIIILVLILVFLIGNFFPTNVSYKTTENYTEQVPYTENVPLQYSIVKPLNASGNDIQIVIMNTDNVAGTYNANFLFSRADNGKTSTITKSINLIAGETGVIAVSTNEINLSKSYGEGYTFSYSATIIPSQKAVQKTRVETKTGEVTKEKQVNLWVFIIQSFLNSLQSFLNSL